MKNRLSAMFVFVSAFCGCPNGSKNGSIEDALTQNDISEFSEIIDAKDEIFEDTKETIAIPPECELPEDCEDQVGCTENVCNWGKCEFRPDAEFCNDSDSCTIDLCSAKKNLFGGCEWKPKPCDDNNECTLDSCDKIIGCVSNLNGGKCDDSNACTTDVCEKDGCEHWQENCDDGDVTTFDGCKPSSGCYHHTIECGEGFQCIHSDECMIGKCLPDYKCAFESKVCADDVNCTHDVCEGGECKFKPKNSLCPDNDENACTKTICDSIEGCVITSVACDDEKPYTNDYCDPQKGCVYTSIDGWCDNANQCELGLACAIPVCNPDHTCSYVKKICDDGVFCTVDFCDSNGYCGHQTDNELCENGLYCNYEAGKCTECVFNIHCSDDNQCTEDSCDYYGDFGKPGSCIYTEKCEWPYECNPQNGICESADKYCGDNLSICESMSMPCKIYECVNDYCVNTITLGNGDVCSSDNVCSYGTCFNGVCEIVEDNCDDSNPCTLDWCDEEIGCAHTDIAEGEQCDDNDPCTSDEKCVWGWCVSYVTHCYDGNPCTYDNCKAGVGCYNQIDETCEESVCSLKGYWGCEQCNPQAIGQCYDNIKVSIDECVKFDGQFEFSYNCVYGTPQPPAQGVGLFCFNDTVFVDVKNIGNQQTLETMKEIEPLQIQYYEAVEAIQITMHESPTTEKKPNLAFCVCVDNQGKFKKIVPDLMFSNIGYCFDQSF